MRRAESQEVGFVVPLQMRKVAAVKSFPHRIRLRRPRRLAWAVSSQIVSVPILPLASLRWTGESPVATWAVLKWERSTSGYRSTPQANLSDIWAIMSDMRSDRVTIRIPQTLGQRLRHRSRIQGQSESELVREALETYLGQSPKERPAFELAEEAGLIGCVRRAPPKDLSTNRRYFEDFGKK